MIMQLMWEGIRPSWKILDKHEGRGEGLWEAFDCLWTTEGLYWELDSLWAKALCNLDIFPLVW